MFSTLFSHTVFYKAHVKLYVVWLLCTVNRFHKEKRTASTTSTLYIYTRARVRNQA